MKKIFLTIFSIVLVFSLAACSQKSSTKEEKVLKLGVVPSSNSEKLVDDLEPFAKALGEKLGVKVEVFTASSYIGVIEGIGSGSVDFGIVPPFSAVLSNKQSNTKNLLVGKSLNGKPGYHAEIFVRKDSNIKSLEDLKGKTIGVQLGSIQEQFAKDNGSVPKLYNNFTEALLDLQNQKIDAVIIAEVSGIEYLKTMKGIKKIDTIKDKLPNASIAFRKVDSKLAKEFSDAILKLKNSPEYAKLVKKYFPEPYDNL